MKRDSPDASVILLTFQSYKHKGGSVEHVIATVLNQTLSNFELIIVDNSGEEANRDTLLRFIRRFPLHVSVVFAQANRGAARNQGAKMARGRNLIFLDDETFLVERDSLAKAVRALEFGPYSYGARRSWTPPLWFEENRNALLPQLLAGDNSLLIAIQGPPEATLAVGQNPQQELRLRRSLIGTFGSVLNEAFFAVGGFPEDYDDTRYEDDVLILKLYTVFGKPIGLHDISVVNLFYKTQYNQESCEKIKILKFENQKKFQELATQLNQASFNPIYLLASDNPIQNINLSISFSVNDYTQKEKN